MPVADGLLEKQPVRVLRDTGCSTVVVRRSLIPEENLTDQEERCILIDGTVRQTPIARIFIGTPYFTGTTTAVCMKNMLYDVIIGNIPGATDPTTSQPASAVQTRSQVKATKGQSPLITPLIDLGSEDVTTLQEEDSTPKSYDSRQRQVRSTIPTSERFLVPREGQQARPNHQSACTPAGLRQRVMTLAHAGVMSGHQGVHRTLERVIKSFWWPGMSTDVNLFRHSCDICQRTVSKGRIPKVSLRKMPIIDTPFKRVAVDLVGKIFPASS